MFNQPHLVGGVGFRRWLFSYLTRDVAGEGRYVEGEGVFFGFYVYRREDPAFGSVPPFNRISGVSGILDCDRGVRDISLIFILYP